MIKKRTRFFLAVEGESERSFIRWLQQLSDERLLQIHLDTYPLSGGGFKSMLTQAVYSLKREVKNKGAYRDRFLIVDSDRADQGDWSIEKLRLEAAKYKITVCIQNPKYEAVLLRMTPGRENSHVDAASAERQLTSIWPSYHKPVDARSLGQRFILTDLLRMARSDSDFRTLLQRIGLMDF